MPRGDQTGPRGMGSRTGRGMGFCAGYNSPGYVNTGCGFGRGMGRGFGRSRGFGQGFRARLWGKQSTPVAQPAVLSKEEEKQLLEQDLKDIEAEKQEIQKRLKEIK